MSRNRDSGAASDVASSRRQNPRLANKVDFAAHSRHLPRLQHHEPRGAICASPLPPFSSSFRPPLPPQACLSSTSRPCAGLASPKTHRRGSPQKNAPTTREWLAIYCNGVSPLCQESVQQCAKMVSEGPAGSYLALLGCIEQSKKAAGEATRDGPPQSPPGIATQGSSPSALAGSALAPNQTDISPRAEQVKSSNIASTPSSFHFSHDLGLHLVDPEVKQLQIFLNRHGFPVAADGPGSPGHEVEIFGRGTKAALELFQRAHAKEIAITQATGHFGAATRKYINHF